MCPADLLEKLLDRENLENEKFIFVFCSGSTVNCAYDDISALLNSIRTAGVQSKNYHLHLDAALGGMITPFIKGNPVPLDFSIEEVSSLSVSIHKRMGISNSASIFLARKQILNSLNKVDVDYVNTVDTTLGGSRDGFTPFVTYSIMKSVGKEGFQKRTEQVLSNAQTLCEKLADYNAWRCDYSPCVIMPIPSESLRKKYSLPIIGDKTGSTKGFTHVFTMEHVTESKLDEFVLDYKNDMHSENMYEWCPNGYVTNMKKQPFSRQLSRQLSSGA